jgi:hypothetical protein
LKSQATKQAAQSAKNSRSSPEESGPGFMGPLYHKLSRSGEVIMENSKVCTKCKVDKPLSDFPVKRGRYISSWCHACSRANWRKYSLKRKARRKLLNHYDRIARFVTRLTSGRVCSKCGEVKVQKSFYSIKERQCKSCRLKSYPVDWRRRVELQASPEGKASRERRRWALKMEFITAYGGKCTCCGESEPRFLTLEHIYHDGYEERLKYGTAFHYARLKKLGWPKDRYTLYCMNCNFSTRFGEPCPHKTLVRVD